MLELTQTSQRESDRRVRRKRESPHDSEHDARLQLHTDPQTPSSTPANPPGPESRVPLYNYTKNRNYRVPPAALSPRGSDIPGSPGKNAPTHCKLMDTSKKNVR